MYFYKLVLFTTANVLHINLDVIIIENSTSSVHMGTFTFQSISICIQHHNYTITNCKINNVSSN